MGGFGSGHTGPRPRARTRVERCATLDIAAWLRAGLLAPGSSRRGSWACPAASRRGPDTLAYAIELGDDGRGEARLSYTLGHDGPSLSYPVSIRVTRPHFGGLRRWFLCPGAAPDSPCGRRAAKLYRPPRGRRFACRDCHRLAYRSSQRAHYAERQARRDALLRILARGPGVTSLAQAVALCRDSLRAITPPD